MKGSKKNSNNPSKLRGLTCINSTGTESWFKLNEFEEYSRFKRLTPCKFGYIFPLPSAIFLVPNTRGKADVIAWNRFRNICSEEMSWDILQRVSSSLNQLSSHTLLAITYARLVQTLLQILYLLDKSKLHTEVCWQGLRKCLVSLGFSSNCGAAPGVYSNLSDICEPHLNLYQPSAQFCWIVTLERDSINTANGLSPCAWH